MPIPQTSLAPCHSWLNTPVGFLNLSTVAHIAFVTGVSGGNPIVTMDPTVWWATAQLTRQIWVWLHTEKIKTPDIKIENTATEDYADFVACDIRFTP